MLNKVRWQTLAYFDVPFNEMLWMKSYGKVEWAADPANKTSITFQWKDVSYICKKINLCYYINEKNWIVSVLLTNDDLFFIF